MKTPSILLIKRNHKVIYVDKIWSANIENYKKSLLLCTIDVCSNAVYLSRYIRNNNIIIDKLQFEMIKSNEKDINKDLQEFIEYYKPEIPIGYAENEYIKQINYKDKIFREYYNLYQEYEDSKKYYYY